MNNCMHAFDPALGELYTRQFKREIEEWENKEIDSRQLFYQLNQPGKYLHVMPGAYAFIVQQLKKLEAVYLPLDINDSTERAIASLVAPQISSLSAQLQTEDHLSAGIHQIAAIQLTQACWLQNIPQVSCSQMETAVQLLSLYLQFVGAGRKGSNLQSLYRSLLLASGQNMPILHSYEYSQQAGLMTGLFDGAALQLALARFPRVLLPEILGFTLAYCQLPTLLEICFPDQQRAFSFYKIQKQQVQQQLLPLRACIASYLDLFPEQKQSLWQRIQAGFWLYHQQMLQGRDCLQKGLYNPPSVQQAVAQLLQQKAVAAIGHHQKIQLQEKTLDSWFADLPGNSSEFLLALNQSGYVNQKNPEDSRLLKLFEFKGPMFGVLDPSELDIIKKWLHRDENSTIPESDLSFDSTVAPEQQLRSQLCACNSNTAVKPKSYAILSGIIKPSSHSGLNESSANPIDTQKKTLLTGVKQAQPGKLLHKKYAALSNRELYYYLLNADLFPDVLPVARAQVRNRLRLRTLFNPLPFKHYNHQQFDVYIDTIYQQEVNAYQPLQGKPKISKEAYIWGLEQIAPVILIDGCWLQNSLALKNVNPDICDILFKIYCDEIGNGRLEQNHPYIFQQLLESLSIQLPPVHSEAFVKHSGFIDSAFDLPVYMLALSSFSVEFLPELLGLNMAIELSGLGNSYMRLVDDWNYWGIDPSIANIHISIDNAASGHTFQAKNAIKLYMDEMIHNTADRTLLDKHWRRIYSGYTSLRFVGGRFKLGLPIWYLIYKFTGQGK